MADTKTSKEILARQTRQKSVSARSIAFIAVIALICFSPVLYFACTHICPSLSRSNPGLAGGTASTTVTAAEIKADPIGAYLDGRLIEKANNVITTRLENYIPLHDSLLLTCSNLQEIAIAQSAGLYGYETIPTFYGSEYSKLGSLESVAPTCTAQSADSEQNVESCFDAYSEQVESHPEINWVFYVCDLPQTVRYNETTQLVSDAADYEYYLSLYKEKLPSEATIISDDFNSLEEYKLCHFKTDHHWTIQGALRGYNRTAKVLGISEIGEYETVTATFDKFYGSAARSGLSLDYCDDGVQDVALDISSLQVEINGEQVDPGKLDKLYALGGEAYTKQYETENLYATMSHGDYATIDIINPDIESGTLMIIADSYSSCLERFYAQSYHRVVVIDPRLNKSTLSQVVNEYAPDCVLSMQVCNEIFESRRLAFLTGESTK